MDTGSYHTSWRKAALYSVLVPGLGLLTRGFHQQAGVIFTVTAVLSLGVWWAARWGGAGAGIVLWLLILVPWWIFQSFQAALAHPDGIVSAWKLVWERGHDIRYLGGLFLFSAATDLFIIIMNPEYHLHVFCTRPTGIVGTLAKIQSPFFHILIGYGFLRVLRWSLFVYMVYAGYGLTNALVNFACEGYGRIRTVFFLTLIAFSLYVFLRRRCFVR